jgi:hypothetical protein
MTATTALVAERVESAEPTMRSAQQVAEEEGLTFAGTPGPGYSEGGDVYAPKAARKSLSEKRLGARREPSRRTAEESGRIAARLV